MSEATAPLLVGTNGGATALAATADAGSDAAAALAARLYPRARIKFNDLQDRTLAAFVGGAREVLVLAGNRSGKTLLGALWTDAGAVYDKNDEVSWVCCESSKVQREGPQPYVTAFLGEHEYAVGPGGRRLITQSQFKIDRIQTIGGVIQFRNYCDGAASVTAASVTRSWLDEARDLAYYKEVRARLIDTGGKMLITLTPIFGRTDLLMHLLDERDDIAVVSGSMRDNEANLPPGAIDEFEKTLDEWERAVRIEGRVLPLGGRPFVPGSTLVALKALRPKVEVIRGFKIEIYEDPAPGEAYVIGGDSADGVGRDRSAAVVLRVTVGSPLAVVAVFVADAGPEALEAVMAELARKYKGRRRNTALVQPEVNGRGMLVLERLVAHNVDVVSRESTPDAVAPSDWTKLGFLTTTATRPMILDAMRDAIVKGHIEVRSDALIQSLGAFVWSERTGRPEAAQGYYDDPVMALALAVDAASRLPAEQPVHYVERGMPKTVADHVSKLRKRDRGDD